MDQIKQIFKKGFTNAIVREKSYQISEFLDDPRIGGYQKVVDIFVCGQAYLDVKEANMGSEINFLKAQEKKLVMP